MTDTLAPQTSRITAGPWKHRGSIIVSYQIPSGQVETVRIPEDLVALQNRVTDGGVDLVLDGGGAVLTTGIKLDVEVPYNLTLQSMRLMADQTGSIVLDILKAAYASFPGSAASICGAALPTLSSAQKTQDTTLTGWTTTLNKGDWLRINVLSVATIQRLTLSLAGVRF